MKKNVSVGNLIESPTRRVGGVVFHYEYLREFEAKIGMAQNAVSGTYAEPQKPQKICLVGMPL
jgi:hypothetical protein